MMRMVPTGQARTSLGLIVVIALASCAPTGQAQQKGGADSSPSTGVEGQADPSVVALAECLRDKGWSVVIHDGGVGPTSLPSDQVETYSADMNSCMAEFEAGVDKSPPRADQLKDLYRSELATRDCLARNGYSSATAPSSESAYVAAVAAGAVPPWSAYGAVGQISLNEFRRLERLCPQPVIGP